MKSNLVISKAKNLLETKYPKLKTSNLFNSILPILFDKYKKWIIQSINTEKLLSSIKSSIEKKYPEIKQSENFDIILKELLIKITLHEYLIEQLSLKVSNTKELFNKGWKIYGHLLNEYNPNCIPNGIIGKVSSGKTHVMNLILSTSLFEIPTDSINCYYFINQRNLIFIDTPGLKKQLSDKDEENKRDIIIQSFVLETCINIFYVVNSFDECEQKDCNKFKGYFIKNRSEEKATRTLFIIHNICSITTIDEYNKYIKDYIITKESKYKVINEYISEIIEDPYINENRRIVHIIVSPYNREKAISLIKKFISVTIQIPSITFDKMIENSFQYITKGIYPNRQLNVIIKDKRLKIEDKGSKEILVNKTKKNENKFDEIEIKENNKSIIEETWDDFQNKAPPFNYYISNENHFVIAIESVNLKTVSLCLNESTDSTSFYFIGEKEKQNENDLYSNMHYSSVRLMIDIPKSFVIFETFSLIKHKYKSGILYLEYLIKKPV